MEKVDLDDARRMVALFLLTVVNLPSNLWAANGYRLELSNDVIFSSDNQFTNGTSLVISSSAAETLADTGGTPAFGKQLLSWSIPHEPGLAYRESWVLGQNIQTPADIEESALIPNDVPYLGLLGVGNSFYGFDDERFYGAGWLIGWIGKEAMAEQAQRAVHAVLEGKDPAGWDNQLDSEPVLNGYFSTKRRIFRHRWFDVALAGDIAVGNLFTFIQPGLEFRMGDRPVGFHSVPNPIGRGMDYDATLPSGPGSNVYTSVTVRATYFARVMPREGNLLVDNLWTDTNVVDINRTVGQAIIGLHWSEQPFAVHLSLWLSTKTVDQSNLPPSEDPRNSFGSFMAEYRF